MIQVSAGPANPLLITVPTPWGTLFSPHVALGLRDGQSCLGLRTLATELEPVSFQLDELAHTFAAEVSRRYPSAPVAVVGFCSSGYLAVEIARRLTMAGHDVRFTGFVQAKPPSEPRPESSLREEDLIREIEAEIGSLQSSDLEAIRRSLTRSIRSYEAYAALPYDGRAVLFFAADEGDQARDEEARRRWKSYLTGELSTEVVAGSGSLLRPPSAVVLGAALQDVIDREDAWDLAS